METMKTYKDKISLISLSRKKADFQKAQIVSSKDAAEYARKFYGDDIDIFESTFIVLLNRANTTIAYAKISQGGVCGTVVDPLIIAKYAVETLAKGVILVHNHPSGNLRASEQDIAITKKVKQGLQLFDCSLLDHIILSDSGYYSLVDNGDM